LGYDCDTGREAELISSLCSLGDISSIARLLNASSGPADERSVGAGALEVGQGASGGLKSWEETALSTGWDVVDGLGRGDSDGCDGDGDGCELHSELILQKI